MKNLEMCFEAAKHNKAKYIGISIEHKNVPEKEIRINPEANFDSRLEYYKKTYDDDLRHKMAPENVKIFGITFGDSFSEIEEDLL